MESPIKMDDLGVPRFLETPICNPQKKMKFSHWPSKLPLVGRKMEWNFPASSNAPVYLSVTSSEQRNVVNRASFSGFHTTIFVRYQFNQWLSWICLATMLGKSQKYLANWWFNGDIPR